MDMDAKVVWKDNMAFAGKVGSFTVPMDAFGSLGHNYGPSPKDLVALGVAGNTAMDVIGLLRKEKQKVEHFEVEAKVTSTENCYPSVFSAIDLYLRLEGNIEWSKALKAVQLSQTTYCGVSAMLYKALPIRWHLHINGQEVGNGISDFEVGEEVFRTSFEG